MEKCRAVPSYPINAADGLCAGAAALCILVTRDAQWGLTKAAPRAVVAEHASTTSIECDERASLPAEGSRTNPRLRDTWRLRTPTQYGRSGWTQEVPDPYRGPRPRLSARSFPSLGTRGVSGPNPRRGMDPGPLAR